MTRQSKAQRKRGPIQFCGVHGHDERGRVMHCDLPAGHRIRHRERQPLGGTVLLPPLCEDPDCPHSG